MKKTILFCLMITISVFGLYADGYPNASINLEHRHTNHNHNYIVPVDMPDVYYDNVNHTIIIDGGGEVSHYDVEIAPVSTFVPVISTQVNGFYDTIDVSSLSATEYVITIYSPEGNIFDGYFDTY